MRKLIFAVLVLSFLLLAALSLWWKPVFWLAIFFLFVFFLAIYDITQKHSTILRNFPVIGHFRYLLESIRPEIRQYFVESDINGRPFDRNQRAFIYRRAKEVQATHPFGTQLDLDKIGAEWLAHSMYPVSAVQSESRVQIGSLTCTKPYAASLLNISAMSFGALSKNAILALNIAARKRGFYHNTGEGGISPYHLQGGGDLVWQLGTAYFGCRDEKGNFSPELFKEKSQQDAVKMIEIKLSQGAKPGHGGVLPAIKNTPEIAAIRGLQAHQQVVSPPFHQRFHDPSSLLDFILELRELSGGKPVGIKLCIGSEEEWHHLVACMERRKVWPDFVTVDGAEGGTGAAPLEFSNWVGMALEPALVMVHDSLLRCGLRQNVKVIASGKIINAFWLLKHLALGADLCNSARGMMMAIGCIQALRCNTNQCPTGVATQDPALVRGLDVTHKAKRAANFHRETLHLTYDLVAAMGLSHPNQVKRKHLMRRVSFERIMSFEEIYPTVIV